MNNPTIDRSEKIGIHVGGKTVDVQGISTNGALGWRIFPPNGNPVTHYDESYAAATVFKIAYGREKSLVGGDAAVLDAIAEMLP